MIALKANQEFTITEADVQSFVNEGYDIYDDNGNLVHYGMGKTVSYQKYMKMVEECEKLQEEILVLNDTISKLKKRPSAKKEG